MSSTSLQRTASFAKPSLHSGAKLVVDTRNAVPRDALAARVVRA